MPDPASSFFVGNAPQGANYAAPLLSFAPLAGLPDDFYRGRQNQFQQQQNQRTLELQRPVLDENGLPTSDPHAVLSAAVQRGGLQSAIDLLPFEQKQQFLDRLRSQDNGGDPGQSAPPTAPTPNSAAPPMSRPDGNAASGANLRLPPQRTPQPQQPLQPALSSAGTDNNGSDTVRSIATETFRGDVSPLIPRFAAAFKVDPDSPLTPQQAAVIRNRMAATNNSTGQNGTNAALQTNSGASGSPAPVSGPSPGSASAGASPAPQSSSPGPNGASAPMTGPTPSADAIVPQEYRGGRALEYAQQQRYLQQRFLNQAQEAEVMGVDAQGLRDRGAAAGQRAQAVEAALAKDSELTPGQHEWLMDRRPGETQADYQARVAGAKKGAEAPYDIAIAALRQGGRPVAVKPNEVVTTGAQVNPALNAITDWATNRLGLPSDQPVPPNSGMPAQNGSASAPAPPSTSPATAPGQNSGGGPAPNTSAPPVTGQSPFTPRLVRNPDGSVASSVTPSTEAIQKGAADNYEKAREAYGAAQTVQEQLASMEDSFRKLNSANWSTTGTGAEARLQLGKAVNTVWSVLGVKDQDLPFDPDAIASWQRLTKDTTRLGFSLARTLGAREAMQIVQGAIKANPNTDNTPLGARMVLNAIRENAQRDSDYFEYATKYAQSNGGDLVGAEVAFNKLNPPSL